MVVVVLLATITPTIAIRYEIGNGIFPAANVRNYPLPYSTVVGSKTEYGCINPQWHFGSNHCCEGCKRECTRITVMDPVFAFAKKGGKRILVIK
ncbi:hypothetical protein SLE2022_121100 [Rubroshorea leprosula]